MSEYLPPGHLWKKFKRLAKERSSLTKEVEKRWKANGHLKERDH